MSTLAILNPDESDRSVHFQAIAKAEERANALVVHDEQSESVALTFVVEIRTLSDKLEAMRDSEVRPLNTRVKEINDAYRPYKELCQALGDRVGGLVGAFRARQRLEREEAQRKAIEEANRKRAEEEARAAELRRLADEAREKEAQPVKEVREEMQDELSTLTQRRAIARAQGDEDALLAIEAKIEQIQGSLTQLNPEVASAELEAQAQQAELMAATVAPEVVQPVKQTVVLSGGRKFTFSTVTVPVCLPGGLPLEGDYYRDDVRLRALPDDLFILDLSRLKKRVKDGQKFEGVTTTEKEAGRRGGR